MRIVISSGHGKHVSGANGILNEVTEARKVVPRVAYHMRKTGAEVVEFHDDTSKSQNINVNTIVAFHNAQARDLDISVHFNAASSTAEPRGVEVLYYSELELAERVAAAISKASGLKNRGAKRRPDLAFLNGTKEPAILIEVCFVDSEADAKIYRAKFDEICKAIAETVVGKEAEERSIDTPEEAVAKLAAVGIITDTKYWLDTVKCVKYQGELFVRVANRV